MTTATVNNKALTPPREAAVAGIVFSFLMIIGLVIIRLGLPDVQVAQNMVNPGFEKALALAVHLVPFAGIAFLWLLGVLRSRMGAAEDKFFATVFMGSGLLFVASLFAASALVEGVLRGASSQSAQQISSDVYYFAREASYSFLNVFGIKMAGVFLFSTCTIALRTGFLPRWIAFFGFACGLALLVIISDWLWIAMLLPIWTMLVSVYILSVRPPVSEVKVFTTSGTRSHA